MSMKLLSPNTPCHFPSWGPSSKGPKLTGRADHSRLKAFAYQHYGYTFPLTGLPSAFLCKTSSPWPLPRSTWPPVSKPYLEVSLVQCTQCMCLQRGLCPQAFSCSLFSSLACTGTDGHHLQLKCEGLWLLLPAMHWRVKAHTAELESSYKPKGHSIISDSYCQRAWVRQAQPPHLEDDPNET